MQVHQCGLLVGFHQPLPAAGRLCLKTSQCNIGAIGLSGFQAPLDHADRLVVQCRDQLVDLAQFPLVQRGEIQSLCLDAGAQFRLPDRAANLFPVGGGRPRPKPRLPSQLERLHDHMLLAHRRVVAIAVARVRQDLRLKLRIERIGLRHMIRSMRHGLARSNCHQVGITCQRRLDDRPERQGHRHRGHNRLARRCGVVPRCRVPVARRQWIVAVRPGVAGQLY